MDNKDVKDGNSRSSQKSETQDNLTPSIQIKLMGGNIQVTWSRINSTTVEDILITALRQVVYYNVNKAIEEKNKPKILTPNIGDIMAVTK